jgi:hypothetical protein
MSDERNGPLGELARYPLIEALLHRRSRRFAPGMTLDGGPLAYRSAAPPEPLSVEEEAALAFAACGGHVGQAIEEHQIAAIEFGCGSPMTTAISLEAAKFCGLET